jgi:hypothetical protein
MASIRWLPFKEGSMENMIFENEDKKIEDWHKMKAL